MKQAVLFTTLLLLLFSCSKEDNGEVETGEVEITLNKNQLGFPSSGGSGTFEVTANGPWTISGTTDWCSVSPASGNGGTHAVTVNIRPAELEEDRNTVLSVGNKNITVTQKKTGALTLTPDKYTVSLEGETIEVTVEHNTGLTITVPDEYSSWIIPVKGRSMSTTSYHFRIEPAEETRQGEIIFATESGDRKETIYIYQVEKDQLVLGLHNQTINREQQNLKVELRTNFNYRVQIEEGVTWIKHLPDGTRAMRDDVAWFQVDELPESEGNREVEITFIDSQSEALDKLILCQLADGALFLMRSKFELEATGGTVVVKLKEMDFKVEVIEGESWLTRIDFDDPAITTRAGSQLKTDSIAFLAYTNYAPASREGRILVTDESTGDTDIIYVSQKQKNFITNTEKTPRLLFANIANNKTTSGGGVGYPSAYYNKNNDRMLVSWRMLPNDTDDTAFTLFRTDVNGLCRVTDKPILLTNIIDHGVTKTGPVTYSLYYYHDSDTPDPSQFIESYTIEAHRITNGLPYLEIPLLPVTHETIAGVKYIANDASVGHLLGGEDYQVLIRRNADGVEEVEEDDDEDDGSALETDLYSPVILEAYELNGNRLWTIICGPNITSYNGICFPIGDFNGDGYDDIAVRTAEGTIFGDGKILYNKDGKVIDYRPLSVKQPVGHEEYLSIIDGRTGKEIGRAPTFPVTEQESWIDPSRRKKGDSYKRANSIRITAIRTRGSNGLTKLCPVFCRGIYWRSALEAWDFTGTSSAGDYPYEGTEDHGKPWNMTKLWTFDSNNWDENTHPQYYAQGYHSLSVGDVDADGYDEITYGSIAIDHDGSVLYTTGLGHGDSNHLGDFDPKKPGLEFVSCFETGFPRGQIRNARTGANYWTLYGSSVGDEGRIMVGDIDPRTPGCEIWFYQSGTYSTSGQMLNENKPGGTAQVIWFTGTAHRQVLSAATGVLDYYNEEAGGYNTRPLMFGTRWGTTRINSTKDNPCWYGDIFGDWREEIIMSSDDGLSLKVFSTFMETEYKVPYLMSDDIYWLSAMNQHVGYNQPNHLGYYFGADNAADFKAKQIVY